MLKVNTNKSDFKALLKDKAYYYVDKTSFIKEFISIEESEFSINLILRPRRFGKSLNQSMLKYFFDIDEKDSAFIFEGLEVSKDKEFCAKFQNKFPVIFLTFKALKAESLEDMLNIMNANLREEYARHAEAFDFLTENSDQVLFNKFRNGEADLVDYTSYLSLLMKPLYKQYSVNPIVLLDEYDVPLDSAYQRGYFDKFITTFTNMLSEGLKDNNLAGGAVITGCLQIAKNNLFTGLNNPLINDVSDCTQYNTAFGFTAEEVQQMLVYYNLEDKEPAIKDWYDGYRSKKSKHRNRNTESS